MGQTPPKRPLASIRSKVILWLVSIAILSIPLLLPRFAGHRLAWLSFLLVVHGLALLFTVAMTGLEHLLTARRSYRITDHPIAKAAARLVVCCFALPILYHYAALPSDLIFVLVTIPSLVAFWFIFRDWRTLFAALARELHWSAQTCRVIGLLIVAAGLALRPLLSPHHAALVLPLFTFVALGCSTVSNRKNRPLDGVAEN